MGWVKTLDPKCGGAKNVSGGGEAAEPPGPGSTGLMYMLSLIDLILV